MTGLNCCWLVIWTTAGLTCCATDRTAVNRPPATALPPAAATGEATPTAASGEAAGAAAGLTEAAGEAAPTGRAVDGAVVEEVAVAAGLAAGTDVAVTLVGAAAEVAGTPVGATTGAWQPIATTSTTARATPVSVRRRGHGGGVSVFGLCVVGSAGWPYTSKTCFDGPTPGSVCGTT